MIPFKSRSAQKQYIRGKRHPWGIKLWGRAVWPNRLKGLDLKIEKHLKKESRGSCDTKVEVNSNTLALRWYDNRAVNVVSRYRGVEPVKMENTCKRKGPVDDVRKDGIDHFPYWSVKRDWCSYCNAHAHLKCFKCNVSLCVNKDRNCFLAYHKS
ncbi:hypothetical protein RRG08_058443 [Elysia crispata]|uniref:PiggyBac transposable element-derived protein domain-containing protein n=1 Tax=Elysia crispata TaxID=231223 RepID=A0AAE1CPX4_9GAST|nr:hypothetical protein RRG08_058443 [Elysia crispata]